jgi:hypothetical protein
MRNEDEGLAEVTAGLAPGSTVLLARLDGLKDGLVVKLPAPATLPASLPAGTAVAAANVPGKG